MTRVGWAEDLGEVWPVGSEIETLPQNCPDLSVARSVTAPLMWALGWLLKNCLTLWMPSSFEKSGDLPAEVEGWLAAGLEESVVHPLELSELGNLFKIFEVEFFAGNPPNQSRVLEFSKLEYDEDEFLS